MSDFEEDFSPFPNLHSHQNSEAMKFPVALNTFARVRSLPRWAQWSPAESEGAMEPGMPGDSALSFLPRHCCGSPI